MWRTLLFAVAFTLVVVPCARAASCDEEIELFAKQYDLLAELPRAEPPAGSPAPEPPATMESRGVPPEALSRSGGVVEPPEQGRTVTIEPPPTGDLMPTTPEVKPHTAERPSQGAAELGAAKRMQMQSLLNAARAAERQGREAECFERLGEARAIPEPG